MNQKHAITLITITFLAIGGLSTVLAKEKEPNIQENSSGLSIELSNNIARSAIAMGVQEPLLISKIQNNAKVSGSNATICTVKLSTDEEPKMLGISCK